MTFYKFLNDNLSSYHNTNFYYPSPTFKDGKWIPSEWIKGSDFEVSKEACGKGLHLMKILNPMYTQYKGNCYEAEGEGLLGEDEFKARFKKIRLVRPVSKEEIFRPNANLRSANLSFADLNSANLRFANLRSANLSFANLNSANLNSANLRFADLDSANLSFANLNSANLNSANLRFADLNSANLNSANLRFADLCFADLRSARNINESINLDKAKWNKFTLVDKEFKKLWKKDMFEK
jgi:hypothetical protein